MLISMVQKLFRDKQSGLLRLVIGRRFTSSHNVKSFQQLNRFSSSSSSSNLYFLECSAMHSKQGKVCQKRSSRPILLAKLERALKEYEIEEAWETYKEFKSLYGFPDQCSMANLITNLSYSSDSMCLRRAFDLVLTISKEKSVLLRPKMLTNLALSLSRAQIPVPASSILRLMLEKNHLPSLDVLQMIFLHLVKTETGTYLASNVLEEISYCFLNSGAKRSAQTGLTKPDAVIFNLVLDACVRFEAPLKGQQILELMPQLGVIADAHTAVIIARLHELNGLRDELKKFKPHGDVIPDALVRHYQSLYDCLLSLHFKFDDIDGASTLLLDLCRWHDERNSFKVGRIEQEKSCAVSLGSDNAKTGLKLQFLPQKLQRDFVCKGDKKPALVSYKDEKFVLSNKGLAKLVIGYRKARRTNELSKLLVSIHSMLNPPQDNSLCSDVIDACVCLGWLETAHDILDDLELENYCVREASYTFLLSAYYRKNMFREAEGLARQMRRVGLAITCPDKMALDRNISMAEIESKELTVKCKTDLANCIIKNTREEDREVHEYNSSIHFFTKAKMIEDAKHTYLKMQKMKIQPNSTTFFHLICGYCSVGMYREITILWADVKRSMESQHKVCSRDVLEMLLIAFIRGGYFERVMEIIGFMRKNKMFLDKWRCKNEFLKLHRDLYRTLTASDAKDDTQRKRIEYVKFFRKWAGIS
ncbi:pentatricopeptide repeat-containing protein At4g17616 [Andrographis paniculata]|uniref:pentatricopeptide repeat-containing protein At4g17616 n=1 Tax=Andrographis paniculata TaxID=175694 RepID=UPI0021E7AC81|nr:pentatricopeptide repeat-containing protein At4g17616 [Andrographis paniculata]